MSKVYSVGQFVNFVEKVFGESKPAGQANIQVVCPACQEFKGHDYTNRKLAIRIKAPHVIHCWVCGFKGKNALYRLISKHRPDHLDEYKQKFINAEELLAGEVESGVDLGPVMLPRGFTLLADLVDSNDGCSRNSITEKYALQALDYLKHGRGIQTKTELWYWKLGITADSESRCKYRIIIPSYDAGGKLSYWTARSWLQTPYVVYKNPPADRKEIVFNELNIDWVEPLTVLEGPFDLLKANQNAVPILGSEELTLEFALLRKIVRNRTPIVLAFDPVPAAQKKQFVLANRLLAFDVPVKILEYKKKDRDIGEMSRNEFMELFEGATQFTAEYDLQRRIRSILR